MSAAAVRLAPVIRNVAFENRPALQKARNGAQAVSHNVGGLGIDVTLLTVSNRRAVTRALPDLAARISPGDEVLFHDADHGIKIAGRNPLLPPPMPNRRMGHS